MTPHPSPRRDADRPPPELIARLILRAENDWAFAAATLPFRPALAPDASHRPGTGRPIREI